MHRALAEQGTNTLDPDDWTQLRAQGHRMLDDMFDYLENIRAGTEPSAT